MANTKNPKTDLRHDFEHREELHTFVRFSSLTVNGGNAPRMFSGYQVRDETPSRRPRDGSALER